MIIASLKRERGDRGSSGPGLWAVLGTVVIAACGGGIGGSQFLTVVVVVVVRGDCGRGKNNYQITKEL